MEQVAEEKEKEDDGDCCGVYTAMLVIIVLIKSCTI